MDFQIAPDSLRLLESRFEKLGRVFEKVEEGPAFMIYSVKMKDSPRKWFEVFQRRVYPAREIEGKAFPPSQAYPSDEAFGKWAWTFGGIEQARAKSGEIKLHASVKPVANERSEA